MVPVGPCDQKNCKIDYSLNTESKCCGKDKNAI